MTTIRTGLIAALPGAVIGLVLLLVLLPTEPAAGVTFSESPWTDEAWTVLGARNMALLGTWATDDLQAYLLQLPFHVAQLGAFEVFGVGIIQARSVSVVLTISTIVLTALLVARHFGRLAGAISGLALGTSALLVYYGRLAYLEPMVAFWLTAAMALLLYTPDRRIVLGAVLGGACLALAVGTKPSSIAAAAGILLGTAITARIARASALAPLLASGVILIAGVGWTVLIGLPNRDAVELVLRWWPEQPIPATPLDWIIRVGRYARASDGANLLALPLYLAAAVGMVATWRRRHTLDGGQLMVIGAAIGWVLLGIGFLVLTAYRPNRYVMPLLPPLAILGGIGVAWLLERMPAGARRYAAIGLVLTLVAPGTVQWSGWVRSTSSRLPSIQAEVLELIDDEAAVEGGVGLAFAMRAPVPTLLSRPAIGMNGGDMYADAGVRWLVADETYMPAWAVDQPDAWAARRTIRCWPWGEDGRECLIRVP